MAYTSSTRRSSTPGSKTRRLGQHILICDWVADRIVSSACLGKDDRVLEIGSGRGVLTKRLAKVSGHVTGYEVDESYYNELSRSLVGRLSNVKLVRGDAFVDFKEDRDYDALVTSLPYSQSRSFLWWIALR
jgi:16S rRNA A1518/A1519 N6-dimethyltransferase RsmA/KsgA/DIM1 with predicted DNA glycosylase/AP lyase activity